MKHATAYNHAYCILSGTMFTIISPSFTISPIPAFFCLHNLAALWCNDVIHAIADTITAVLILLVRALAHKPKLLLLEEPWQSMDEETTQQIQHLLLHGTDATVIVATNDDAFIRQCDQTIALS